MGYELLVGNRVAKKCILSTSSSEKVIHLFYMYFSWHLDKLYKTFINVQVHESKNVP